jgi:hypothetical protein
MNVCKSRVWRASLVLLALGVVGGCGQAVMSSKLKDFDKAFDDSLVLSTGSLAQAQVGKPYAVALAARGAPGPFRWRVVAGSLPPGLQLDARGALRGVPTAAGEAAFVVEVACEQAPKVDEDSRSPYIAARVRRFKLLVQEGGASGLAPALPGRPVEAASGGLTPATAPVPAGANAPASTPSSTR